MKVTANKHTREALVNLQEDIEDEIETSRLLHAKKFSPHAKKDAVYGSSEVKLSPREVTLNAIISKHATINKFVSESAVEAKEIGTLDEMEKNMILKAMKDCDNNRTMVARVLGISIRTLRNKLIRYIKEEKLQQIADEAGGPHV
jgi:DNA-binding NtrC family response regulator